MVASLGCTIFLVTGEEKHLVERFDALPRSLETGGARASPVIAREIDDPAIGDDKLTVAADEIFLEYHEREAGD